MEKKKKQKTNKLKGSSPQSCFVVPYSSGDPNPLMSGRSRNRLVRMNLFNSVFSPIYTSLYFYVLSTVLRTSSFTRERTTFVFPVDLYRIVMVSGVLITDCSSLVNFLLLRVITPRYVMVFVLSCHLLYRKLI